MSTERSYAQILKASSIMGGAAGINLLLGMVRVKFAAVLIGTTGVGLISSFGALQGLIGTLAGLGIQSSAVREIAAAVGKGDEQAIGRAVLALRRICRLTGLVGMAAMMLLAPLLSQLTFGHRDYALDIAALGVIILFGNLSGGQMALIQGMRRIGDMARANIYGAALGTVAAVGFYTALGLRGIIPTLIAVSAIQLALSFHFARRVPVPKVALTWRQTFAEADGMVTLGVSMMWTALLGSLVSYAAISVITNNLSIQAAGIYSAAMALSGLFVSFVLQAMSADYLPRLSIFHDNPNGINQLVNQQTQIGLLLAAPGLIGTIVFSFWIVPIFYASSFSPATELIQWMTLGCLGRVMSWPMGFVLVATKRAKTFFATQTIGHSAHLIFIVISLKSIGLEGTGISFFATYLITIPLNYAILYRIIKFRWEHKTRSIALKSTLLVISSFLFAKFTDHALSLTVGLLLAFLSAYFFATELTELLGPEHRISKSLSKVPLWGALNRKTGKN